MPSPVDTNSLLYGGTYYEYRLMSILKKLTNFCELLAVWHNVTFTDTSKKPTFLKIPFFFGFPVSSVGQGHLQAVCLYSSGRHGGLKSGAFKQCWEETARNSLRSALFFLPWRVNLLYELARSGEISCYS